MANEILEQKQESMKQEIQSAHYENKDLKSVIEQQQILEQRLLKGLELAGKKTRELESRLNKNT
jgi:hypothetical protein